MHLPTLPNPFRKSQLPAVIKDAGATAIAEKSTKPEIARGGESPTRIGDTPSTAFTEAGPSRKNPFPSSSRPNTATIERPGITGITESGLNLSAPRKVDFNNALHLMGVCKQSYTEYTHEVGHTQFLFREFSDHQVIAYSGSKELKDWGHDANVIKMKYKRMGWVHSGFAKAYEEILPLQDTLLKKDKPVVLAGHSLGGATAIVAALDLKHRGYEVHSVYTYGSPRVGYSDFKDIYHKAGIPTYRFVNSYDVVPRVPKINYHHVGEAFYLSSDGRMLPRQESAWKLWPWDIPGQRISSHHLPNYMANLKKYLS